MKRIQSACICQTLRFMCKDDVAKERAVQLVHDEVAGYKKHLEQTRTQYKIVEEAVQPDGSVILKVIKQYNQSPVGDYLN